MGLVYTKRKIHFWNTFVGKDFHALSVVRRRRPEWPEQRDIEGRPRPPSVGYSASKARACLTIITHKCANTIEHL